MIILGLDPGLATTGYGLINYTKKNITLIDYGVILTKKESLFSHRLEIIHKDLLSIINKYKPSKIAIEDLFFCKNTKTALKVGHARGVLILTASIKKIPIFEYTPLQVKQAITSYGKADKKQMQEMVKILLNLKNSPKPDDAADALAVAICASRSINI